MLPKSPATAIQQRPVGNEEHGWEKNKQNAGQRADNQRNDKGFSPYLLSANQQALYCEGEALSLTIGIQRVQPGVHAVVALLKFREDRLVNRLEDERGRTFHPRDAAKEELVGLSSENSVSCHARERLVMHELLHANLHLLLAVSDQLESPRLGDSVNFPSAAKDNAFKVAEASQGGSVDRQRPVRRGEGVRLLFPREEVAMLAAC